MWEQYKKTFFRMQLAIALLCVAIYLYLTHALRPILPLFLMLQVASLAGAHWGARLRKRFNPNG